MGIEKIEISKLSRKMQELAAKADGNNSGFIEKTEIEIFKGAASEAVKNGQISEDDYKAIFGSEIKKAKKTDAEKKQAEYAKREAESRENYVVTILNEEVAASPSEIKAKLHERLGISAEDAKYKELESRVETILNAINEIGYNSKDDVEKLEKSVKEKLKIEKKDDFAKDVLKALVKNAEVAQRSKEYGEIKEAYEKLVKAGMDEEAAYKEARKEFKDKGSYYKDYLKHGNIFYKALHWKRKDSDFEKRTIMPEARATVREAISESDSTSSKGVERDAKKSLEADGDYNRYTKKALGGENNFGDWISGKDSDMKVVRKNRAARNNVYKIREEGLNSEEIHDAVDNRKTFLFFKKKTVLFEALKASGLIVPTDKEGHYDVSNLSMIIGEHVGANYKLDRQSSEFKALAEKTKTTSALAVATELKNLSEEEAKMLVEMCGYKVEGKNWGKAILGATAGALITGLSAGGSTATNKKYVLDSKVNNSNHVELNFQCSGSTLDAFQEQFAGVEGATMNLVEGGLQVIIDQKQVVPLLWEGSRKIMNTALKAAIPGAVLGFLAGLKDDPEKQPITSTQFNCITLEDYEKVLDSEVRQNAIDPKYKDALMMIAATFIKEDNDGNKYWDCDGYKAFLNHAAGNGGSLNREELLGAVQELKDKAPVEHTDEEDDGDEEITTGGDEEGETVPEKCPLEKNNNPVDTTLPHKVKFGDSWEEIVKAYFPSWKECFGKMYGKGGAIQALKKAVSKNEQEYKKLLAGYIPSTINIPEKLGDCVRDDNGKVKFKQPDGSPKGYMGSVGKTTGYNETILTDCDGNQGKGRNVQEALNDLNQKTGKNYTEQDILE